MRTHPLPALLVLSGVAMMVAACGPRQVQTEPDPDPKTATLVMLLPDPGDTVVGRATVASKTPGTPGAVELTSARDVTLVGINQPPTRVRTLTEADVRSQFGDLLATLPPAPLHFILYFRFESDELTAESRALVPDILRAVKDRPVPEIAVTGHTDTTGSSTSNFELGMKRASMVRSLLSEAGLDSSSMEVTSHGEAALLVQTADDTYEPRNRRVEITIR